MAKAPSGKTKPYKKVFKRRNKKPPLNHRKKLGPKAQHSAPKDR